MKTSLLRPIILMTACIVLSGCATTSPERADTASASVSDTRTEMEKVKVNLSAAFTALNTLIEKPAADLKEPYKTYVKSLKDLDSLAQSISKRNEAMKEKSAAYFADWEAQIAAINDQEIKSLSESQRQRIQQAFNEIQNAMQQASNAYRPLMSTLRDIEAYLATNLNPTGVAAIKPKVDSVKAEAVALKDAVNKVTAELNKVASAISSKTAPKP